MRLEKLRGRRDAERRDTELQLRAVPTAKHLAFTFDTPCLGTDLRPSGEERIHRRRFASRPPRPDNVQQPRIRAPATCSAISTPTYYFRFPSCIYVGCLAPSLKPQYSIVKFLDKVVARKKCVRHSSGSILTAAGFAPPPISFDSDPRADAPSRGSIPPVHVFVAATTHANATSRHGSKHSVALSSSL